MKPKSRPTWPWRPVATVVLVVLTGVSLRLMHRPVPTAPPRVRAAPPPSLGRSIENTKDEVRLRESLQGFFAATRGFGQGGSGDHGASATAPTGAAPTTFLSRLPGDDLDEEAPDDVVRTSLDHLERYPLHLATWKRLCRSYVEQGAFSHAEQALERTLELAPLDPELVHLQGLVSFARSAYWEAVGRFALASHLDPDCSEAMFNEALCYLAIEEPYQALQAMERYLRRWPQDPSGLRIKALILTGHGQYKDALACLEQALEQAPVSPDLLLEAAAAAALGLQADKTRALLERAARLVPPLRVLSVLHQPAFELFLLTRAGRRIDDDLSARAGVDASTLSAEPPPPQRIHPLPYITNRS